jgi:hypothetical protein
MKKYRFLILSGVCFVIAIFANLMTLQYVNIEQGTSSKAFFLLFEQMKDIFSYTSALSIIAFIFDCYIIKTPKSD